MDTLSDIAHAYKHPNFPFGHWNVRMRGSDPISANVRTNHSVTALDGALASWFVQGKCQFLTARE